MIESPRAAALLYVLVLLVGCGPKPQKSSLTAEPGVSDDGSVSFDITPIDSSGAAHRWLATYRAGGKTAKFQIEFSAPTGADKDAPLPPVSFGSGKLVAQAGSDATALLVSLKKALEAKRLPIGVERVRELPFKYATFGDKLSRARGGGFNAQPPGDWTATKIFLANGEAEIFLDTNPVLGKGEFSIKDPEYGDRALAELAKVL